MFTIHLPLLRARPDDIDAMTDQFIARFAQQHGKMIDGITPEAMAALRRHDFPGNVRELKNLLERAVILCPSGSPIGLDELPPEVLSDISSLDRGAAERGAGGLRDDMQKYEAKAIAEALQSHGGNRTHAARVLGLSRRTLQEKIARYGLGGRQPADL